MKRGEIWTTSGGIYASKPRLAVILKDDRFSELECVAICPLTSNSTIDMPLIRIAVEPAETNGLHSASHVMVDRITTVRNSMMGSKLGELDHQDMLRIEQALVVFLGIAG